MIDQTPILPAHIEETVAAIAHIHDRHHREATPYQRLIDRLTAIVGRPAFIAVIVTTMILWIAVNLLLPAVHIAAWDPAPFFWMQGAIATTALFVTVLILTTQRRENVLSEARAQLTLELAMVNEQKTAKLIQMVELMRRDNPLIENRIDPEAIAMSQPADPQAMLDAIKESQAGVSAAVTALE